MKCYTYNLAGYEYGHAPSGKDNRHVFAGLSDASFGLLADLERGCQLFVGMRNGAWFWHDLHKVRCDNQARCSTQHDTGELRREQPEGTGGRPGQLADQAARLPREDSAGANLGGVIRRVPGQNDTVRVTVLVRVAGHGRLKTPGEGRLGRDEAGRVMASLVSYFRYYLVCLFQD